MYEYSRKRSKFWMRVYENDNSTTILSNGMVKSLVNRSSPRLIGCSRRGWVRSSNCQDTYNLWILDDFMDFQELEEMKKWADHANDHIWLGLNKNTIKCFTGDELEYCLAADWNYDLDKEERTDVGEAEYQLKYQYPKGLVSKLEGKAYATMLLNSIWDCVCCLPFEMRNFVVTTIPAVNSKQNKLPWFLAKRVSEMLSSRFVSATLKQDKPPMKDQSIENKIQVWRRIYDSVDIVSLSQEIDGAKVLIIDDLYQSGTSVWCYAEYLKKKCGAEIVIAVTAVKALKDGDNK